MHMSESDGREAGNPTGTHDPAVTLSEIVAVMAECEPYGTSELADELGIARRTANKHLDRAAEAGVIEKKKIHSRAVAWYRRPDSAEPE